MAGLKRGVPPSSRLRTMNDATGRADLSIAIAVCKHELHTHHLHVAAKDSPRTPLLSPSRPIAY
eukprot:scaffold33724_cov32-Tisochrysis_lutea.AAC.2